MTSPPKGRFLINYRFEEDAFIHRDLTGLADVFGTRNSRSECTDNTLVVVDSRNDRIDTPAGTFEPCTLLRFSELTCEYGVVTEWWYPGVGLVYWEYYYHGDRFSWPLIDFHRNLPRFVRGDTGSDGSVDLSDAVSLLRYLFQGTVELPCLDAADTDDNGTLELTDAIALLRWMFSSFAAPQPPSPTTSRAYSQSDCGVDPTTLDALQCDSGAQICAE